MCTWFLTKTNLYKWWHNSHLNLRLGEAENNIVADMKKEALSQLSWKQLKILRAADDLDHFLEFWKGPLKKEMDKLRKEKETEKLKQETEIREVEMREKVVPEGENVEAGRRNDIDGPVGNGVILGHDIDLERGVLPREILA
jgi:hypothetical protein